VKVIEQFYDVKTGERGRRAVDVPDLLSVEEAARRQPELEGEQRREDLRAQMQAVLVDEALGLDVTEAKRALCDAFKALR
jgi:hypothetical protein